MWFGGPLDDALLNVQDLLEEVEAVAYELSADEEVEAAATMTRTLSAPLVLVHAERKQMGGSVIAPGALISMLQNGFGVWIIGGSNLDQLQYIFMGISLEIALHGSLWVRSLSIHMPFL
jgi:hypothetical protein